MIYFDERSTVANTQLVVGQLKTGPVDIQLFINTRKDPIYDHPSLSGPTLLAFNGVQQSLVVIASTSRLWRHVQIVATDNHHAALVCEFITLLHAPNLQTLSFALPTFYPSEPHDPRFNVN